MPSFLLRLSPLVALVLLSAGCLEPVPDPPSGVAVSLVPSGSDWSYLDDGTDPGVDWASPDFDESAWLRGPALLGYGVGDESTVLRCRPELEVGTPCPEGAQDPTLTYFLRREVEIPEPERFSRLRLRLIKDDGAIVYLNGEVLARANMRPGLLGFDQPAAGEVDDRLVWRDYRFDSRKLLQGRNVLAVELHLSPPKARRRGPTVGFDLELMGFDPASTAVVRGPYVQQVSSSGALIRWKTSDRVSTEIRWGVDAENLDQSFVDEVPKTDHQARLAFDDSKEIFYRLAAGERALATATYRFAVPESGMSEPVRLWATGGLGTGDRFARRTALAAGRFMAERPPDLWLSLGDSAYERGSEKQFDEAHFKPFADVLSRLVYLPTLGNRDVRTGKDKSDIPFYRLFDLPDDAQMGGVPSGSESYFAVDWGPLHLVGLDTVTGNLSPEKEMLTWLVADLAANRKPFTIVFFHHPPYSHGFFSTDDAEKSGRSFGARQNLLPILEQHGVDLVLAGRSPSYERSVLLHGHYGTSNQLLGKMVLDGGDGRESGDGPYIKKKGGPGTIYGVAGGAATSVKTDFGHPAMAFATAERGSLIVDVEADRLDLRYLSAAGEVLDHVTLVHR